MSPSEQSRTWIRRRSTLIAGLLVALLGSYLCIRAQRSPDVRLRDAEYRAPGGEPVATRLPLHVQSGFVVADLSFVMELRERSPTLFYFAANDCIDSLEINGRTVDELEVPACLWPRGKTLDLARYVHAGDNGFRLTLRNKNGPAGFDVEPSRFDRALVVPRVLQMFLLLGAAALLWFHFGERRFLALGAVFVGGVVVRILYVLATPSGYREHDFNGHIDYVNYVAEHLSLPAVGHCWSCNHPPLYYALMAGWERLIGHVSNLSLVALAEVQLVSLLFSILTLAFGLMIGMVVLPGLVFVSSRINNDALLQCLAFAAILFLVSWWRRDRDRDFLLGSAALALGVLTKNNIALIVPAALVLLALHRRVSWRRKVALAVGFALLMGAAYAAARFPRDEQRKPFAFRTGPAPVPETLEVKPGIGTLIVFDPLKVLESRYNENRSGERRAYLWEYLYRSAFVGEFYLGRALEGLIANTLSLGMLLLAVALFGVVRGCARRRWYDHLPFLLVLGFSLAGIFWLRWSNPYSVAQDFRFIPFVSVPCAYYFAVGASSLPPRARPVVVFLGYAFALVCFLFLVELFLKSHALFPANPDMPIEALLRS